MADVAGTRRFAVWAAGEVDEIAGYTLDAGAEFPAAQLVGITNRCMYHICNFVIPASAENVVLAVQGRNLDCSWLAVASSPYIVVPSCPQPASSTKG